MSELEELKAQKKAIEERIRALKNQVDEHGCVRIDAEHYPTAKPDRHYLAVKYYPIDGKWRYKGRWVSVFSANDKKRVINQIPTIIADLQGLYEKCTEGEG